MREFFLNNCGKYCESTLYSLQETAVFVVAHFLLHPVEISWETRCEVWYLFIYLDLFTISGSK